MSSDYLNLPEPDIDLNSSMSLIGKKDIDDVSPQINYPLIILKNLKTSAVQEHIASILDNTEQVEGKELSFYGLNSTNNLVYWRKGIASRRLRKLLGDYLIDFVILDKPKSQISFDKVLNNNYDYIIKDIINDKPIINYEDLGVNYELNLEDKNIDKATELLNLITNLECKAKEEYNKISIDNLQLGSFKPGIEESENEDIDSNIGNEDLTPGECLDLTVIKDLNISLEDLGGVSFE